MNHWISPEPELLPDFIIGGAMKCGTTTLHQILSKHPKIFIPNEEINFFDIDNILQHSDFNFYLKNKWISQSMDKNPTLMWKWYQEKFAEHKNLIKGEDSTTYLASRIAAERISIQKKEIKLIFLLRQPSQRAYSNYNHLLKSGRATFSFEDTIRFEPFSILNRSLYKEQLEMYYKILPKERIKVILFEDLIKEPELTIKEVSNFLGINYEEFPEGVTKMHSNKGKESISKTLHAKKNLLLRGLGNSNYLNKLPFTGPTANKITPFLSKALNQVFYIKNPLSRTSSKINPETKLFLDDYFYNEMQGIDELVGKKILSKWFAKKTVGNEETNLQH